MDVGLISVETVTLPNRSPSRHDLARYAIHLDLEQAEEGQSLPFRFRLPDQVPLTARSSLWSIWTT